MLRRRLPDRARGVVLFSLFAAMLFWPGPLSACSVPVFRYALERWAADPYQAYVFHRGPLSPSEREALDLLRESADNPASFANIDLHLVDLDDEPTGALLAVWEAEESDDLPRLVVRTPHRSPTQARIWSGPLTGDALQQALDSPVRREVARRLLQGESAVWILLEIGDAARDDAAAELLEAELARMQEVLKLPEALPSGGAPSEPFDSLDTSDEVELKIAFSLLRVSRDDPDERALAAMLLECEEDLHDLDHPLAFPVFGRGRALWALAGAGINADNVRDSCEFLIGPCSCQIKDQNPGADLLMAVAWEDLIEGRAVIDKELPPLAGFSKFEELAAVAAADGDGAERRDEGETESGEDGETAPSSTPSDGAAPAPAASASASAPETTGLLGRNMLIVTVLVIVAVLGGSAVLVMRKT